MEGKNFNYEDGFMGVREKKPETYFRSFKEDYRLRSLIRQIKLNKGNLLDIGCGGGIFTESLPYYYPKAKIFGCDISSKAIYYAQKLGSGKVKFSVIKKKKLPYKDNFFDVCICFDVLEHVPDEDYLVKEVKRILKKGGKFFLIVPCEGQFLTYTWFFQKIGLGKNLTYRFFGHIHPEFTHKRVLSLLEKNGFKIIKKNYSEHTFYQFLHVLFFFLPKLSLQLFFGEEIAKQYTNSALIRSPKSREDPMLIIRNIWYSFFDFLMFYPMNWETIILRNIPLTAWKIHVLAEKKL